MSVQWGIITSVVPPGNWHYPQLLASGQSVRITAFSFEQLLDNMLEFRRRHLELCGAESATIEQVRADLKDYFCKHYKQNCADAQSAPAEVRAGGIGITNYKTPIDKAANWIAQAAAQRHSLVDLSVAGVRAQTCAQCNQNVRWQTGCMPCNDNVLVRIQQFKGSNLRTPYDRQLHSCRVFGHLNEVAIWLTDTHSTSANPPPAHCWKAQENGK
jgi:hypothetical protein